MNASPEEIALSLFNQAIKDTSMEIQLLKAFGGEGESNPNYLREFLKGKVETQAQTMKILATFESDRFIQSEMFEISQRLLETSDELRDLNPDQFKTFMAIWGDDSTDIKGTINSAKRL
jgi:hypothetical protein